MSMDVEACYKKYGPMVFRRCLTLLKEPSKAEDAMQEVFLNLIRHQERLTGEYPSSLLYRMATHVCLNLIRGENRKREDRNTEILDQIACYEDHEERLAAKDVLNRFFGRQKESTRVLATLYYVDGLTLEEVARETGMSVSGVRKRLRRMKEEAAGLNWEVAG